MIDDGTKNVLDVVAASLALGAVMDLLPPIAALLTVVYTVLRIWESHTVQRIIARFRKDPPYDPWNPED